jgi:carbamoyl-phosphate synthase small subunit
LSQIIPKNYSHHDAVQSLADWCKASGVPAIQGVDTRAITKKLREKGAMLGQLIHSGEAGDFFDPNTENLVAKVSPKEVQTIWRRTDKNSSDRLRRKRKYRSLAHAAETTVIRVPWDYDFNKLEYRALALSNGPGDPTMCGPTVEQIKKAMAQGKPIVGVCLGNQLLALAAGAKTYKLPYGHRGHNVPCIDTETGRCYITSQNHGFAVDEKTLPPEWKAWFTNANDGSNEGIAHKEKPWRSVQFHPEATPGPTDTRWIFDRFLEDLIANKI